MIKVTAQNGKRESVFHPVHPDWQAWIDASAYTMADARKELGLPNGTFYRRIAKEPTAIDRLAMRALYEGLGGFARDAVAHAPSRPFSRVALAKMEYCEQRRMRRAGMLMVGDVECCLVSPSGRVTWLNLVSGTLSGASAPPVVAA